MDWTYYDDIFGYSTSKTPPRSLQEYLSSGQLLIQFQTLQMVPLSFVLLECSRWRSPHISDHSGGPAKIQRCSKRFQPLPHVPRNSFWNLSVCREIYQCHGCLCIRSVTKRFLWRLCLLSWGVTWEFWYFSLLLLQLSWEVWTTSRTQKGVE